jgi:putative ABC transport system ATP-binding protein
MPDILVEISGLCKVFQMGSSEVRAVDNIHLAVEANSFTVVMGPSGSGKSTLLYLLGGLDRPSSGSIAVLGQRVDEMDENQLASYRQHTVGFIFQSFNLIPNMTAIQNVIFPMRFARVTKAQRGPRASQLLERVGLADRIHHRPTELSGGQQQRVAIARALVNDPQLVLADEPTGNLDTASGASIMQLLSDLHRSGRTVLVVSHDVRMHAYATHKLYLLDGHIVSEAVYQAASLTSIDGSEN